MNVIKSFLRVIGYLLAVHCFSLLALSVCRLILLVANMPAEGIDWHLLPTALLIGVKFDNLITLHLSGTDSYTVKVCRDKVAALTKFFCRIFVLFRI